MQKVKWQSLRLMEYIKMYIAKLPTTKQNEIKRELEKIGINGIDLQLAMDSKLSDIDYLLKKRLDK